jgi:hypothetical protein
MSEAMPLSTLAAKYVVYYASGMLALALVLAYVPTGKSDQTTGKVETVQGPSEWDQYWARQRYKSAYDDCMSKLARPRLRGRAHAAGGGNRAQAAPLLRPCPLRSSGTP